MGRLFLDGYRVVRYKKAPEYPLFVLVQLEGQAGVGFWCLMPEMEFKRKARLVTTPGKEKNYGTEEGSSGRSD